MRAHLRALSALLFLLVPLTAEAALSEGEIQSKIQSAVIQKEEDALNTIPDSTPGNPSAGDALCGGMLWGGDPKLQSHFAGTPLFTCDVVEKCSMYELAGGTCRGFHCTIEECDWEEGCQRAYGCTQAGTNCRIQACKGRCGKLADCRGGTCNPTLMGSDLCGNIASRSCEYISTNAQGRVIGVLNFDGPRSSRKYRCDNSGGCIFNPSTKEYTCGTGSEGRYTADVHCYTYTANFTEPWYYPYAYNCRATFEDLPKNPPGETAVFPRVHPRPKQQQRQQPFQAVQGSAATCAGSGAALRQADRALLKAAEEPEVLIISSLGNARHAVDVRRPYEPWVAGWWGWWGHWYVPRHFPDLTTILTEVRNPPEVRLVLPSSLMGFAAGTGSLLASQISPRLAPPPSPSPLLLDIGGTPDVLEVVAEILQSLPLLSVRFTPVDVLLPTMEEAELRTLIVDWERWDRAAQAAAAGNAAIFTRYSAIAPRVQDNITRMRDEYLPLLRNVRRYRQHFPSYLDRVLSYVEQTNIFLRTWLQENAQRLRQWAEVQKNIPDFARKLRELHVDAMAYVDQCLLNACIGSMPGIPVARDTLPWEVFGNEMVRPPLDLRDRAWLPGAWRIYESVLGRYAYAHPRFYGYGWLPPDLTVDLSTFAVGREIAIPILRIALTPLSLLRPKDVVARPEDIQELWELPLLPKITLPAFPLTPPPLTLPDPKTSLFLLPEPPKLLTNSAGIPIAHALIAWEKKRMTKLKNEACFVPSSKSYLVSEGQLRTQEWHPWYPWQLSSPVFRPAVNYTGGIAASPLCFACALFRPQQSIAAALTVEGAWEPFQEQVLSVADEWNAKISFLSIVNRGELGEVWKMQRWRLVQRLADPFQSLLRSVQENITPVRRALLSTLQPLSALIP